MKLKVASRNKFKMAVAVIAYWISFWPMRVDQIFCIIVMENQQSKTTHGSIIKFTTIQHVRHLESHHVPTTQLRIDILHRIWYLNGKLCPDDGMFKLAIRNKFNTAAANTAFCFQVYNYTFTVPIIPQSPIKTFYIKFLIFAVNRYQKVIYNYVKINIF